MQFFKRLFGLFSQAETTTSPPPPKPPAHVASQSSETTPPATPAPRIFVGWNELIDAQGAIAGYRLRPRTLQADQHIPGERLFQALSQEQIARFAANRPLLIPLTSQQWRQASFLDLSERHTFFLLEDYANLLPEQQQSIAQEIRMGGSRLAIKRHPGQRELPQEVAALIVDFHAEPLADLEADLKAIRQQRPALRLIAENVESWAEQRHCKSLGFDYCQGSFVATRDHEAPQGKISESRLVVMEMLNQLRSDSELSALATTAMRDPAVVVKLIDMANSPAYGLPRKIAKLEEALMLLGRDALYRWLSIALYNLDSNTGRDQTLLVISLCRAALLEGLHRETDKRVADELFLVGLLSVIDSLLGMPMHDILNNIRLPEKVGAALLNNEGPYAPYLQLAIAMERCRLDHAVILAASLQISPSTLVDCYREALGWASAELVNKA